MIRVTREDFESFKRHNDPEVFTQAQINVWVKGLQDLLVKAEADELNDIEKADVAAFNEEFNSFMQVEVVGTSRDLLTKGLEYERFYVREKQIEWDPIEKSEDNEGGTMIEKSRSGKYADTALNRKMGRVGTEFGEPIASKLDDKQYSDEDVREKEEDRLAKIADERDKHEGEHTEDNSEGKKESPDKANGSDFESGKVHVWKQGGSGEILAVGDKFKISEDRKKVSVYIKENKEWEEYEYDEIFP
jgi:hypothetical protein